MTTPNFTPDFTKTGDVFVSRDGTELTFLCDDNDANNDPPIKLGRKGDHYWLYRNGRVFTHREHRMDIVSQYTPTTAPQGVDVPMGGDFHAFARAQSEWSQATFGTDQQRGPIGPLKHLEKEAREAQENPTDIYEFVDCLFLTLDASRRAGFSSESLLHFAWEKLTINKSRDWPKVTDMNAAVEHVREATPAPAADGAGEVQATTPKWPRYLENQQDRGVKFRRVYDSPDAPGRWVDGFVMHLGRFDEAIITQRVIETDAAGNALTPTEPQQASGTDGPLSEFLVSWRDADQLGSNTPLPPQQASGVERYSACRLHGTTEVVTAADHDRVVAAKDAELAEYAENLADTTHTLQDRVKELAERDATIVELRAEVERLKQWELYAWRVIGNLEDAADGRPVEVEEGRSPHPTIKTIDALRTRAEAAEAKVAELELRLANVDKVAVHACDVRDDSIADLELRLATSTESMYVNMKAANEANAQLAAANERVAELEGESKGWHGVVVECEKILKAVGTAEKPLTSNLPNLIRDRLQNLHRAEEQLAELRSTSTIHERDMHAALARITDATARIAKVFGEQIGHGLPIDGPGGCVQWALDGYAKLRAENERLVERFERAKKLLLGYRGWFVRSGRINVGGNIESKLRELYDSLKYAKNDAERLTIQTEMQELTKGTEQHPDWYDYGCECDLCNSYGEH